LSLTEVGPPKETVRDYVIELDKVGIWDMGREKKPVGKVSENRKLNEQNALQEKSSQMLWLEKNQNHTKKGDNMCYSEKRIGHP